ncbi:MAG: helix-turn-helix domain-containing protein [Clostridiaceae bacterium]|nr:helix-turn-helix domain-containing protein [Clostridiaceae bacterium]
MTERIKTKHANGKNKGRLPLFVKYLISYIFISLIPIISAYITYYRSINIIKENARENSIHNLRQIVNTFDQRFAEIDTIISQVSIDVRMHQLMNMESPLHRKENIYNVRTLKDYFASYTISNQFINDMYLYCARGDYIVSKRWIGLDPDRFFCESFFKIDGISLEEMRNDILSKEKGRRYYYYQDIFQKNTKKKMLLVIEPIKQNGFTTNNIIMIVVDYDQFREIIDHFPSGGNIYILDNRLNLVYGSSRDVSILENVALNNNTDVIELRTPEGSLMLSYIRSDYNNYCYVSVLDYNSIMHNVIYIRQLIFVLVFITIVCIILLAVTLAYRNVKPINDVVKNILKLRHQGDVNIKMKQNGLVLIQDFAENIVRENIELEQKMKQNRTYLVTNLFYQLFNNHDLNEYDVKNMLKEWGIELEEGEYLVIICRVDYRNTENPDNRNANKVILNSAIEKALEPVIAVLEISPSRTAFIICRHETHEQFLHKIEAVALKLSRQAREELSADLYFSVGCPVTNISRIKKSYLEAIQAIEYRDLWEGVPIIWGKDQKNQPVEDLEICYSSDMKLKLINAVVKGDIRKLNLILDDIRHQNIDILKLSYTKSKWLLYCLNATMLEICMELRQLPDNVLRVVEISHSQIHTLADFNSIYDAMKRSFFELSNAISIIKNEKKSHLKTKIVEYVKDNFMDPDLCLSKLSEQFMMTESYISTLIKDETGLSFINFLEKLRMEYACKLLLQKNLSINEVAIRAGYNSSYVFRRAFKKYTGVTPSQYV